MGIVDFHLCQCASIFSRKPGRSLFHATLRSLAKPLMLSPNFIAVIEPAVADTASLKLTQSLINIMLRS